jgi:hypothetical protein
MIEARDTHDEEHSTGERDRATTSDDQAPIAHQKLQIEKLRREPYASEPVLEIAGTRRFTAIPSCTTCFGHTSRAEGSSPQLQNIQNSEPRGPTAYDRESLTRHGLGPRDGLSWRKGYEATALSDLISTMGITRPPLRGFWQQGSAVQTCLGSLQNKDAGNTGRMRSRHPRRTLLGCSKGPQRACRPTPGQAQSARLYWCPRCIGVR